MCSPDYDLRVIFHCIYIKIKAFLGALMVSTVKNITKILTVMSYN